MKVRLSDQYCEYIQVHMKKKYEFLVFSTFPSIFSLGFIIQFFPNIQEGHSSITVMVLRFIAA